ncbi:Exocyst complex component 4-like protein [Dinothrombium tinctorium]|uniref:Exocyst complex component Sec8 n=1 Tax=Dinothrombium tinctorium TaxID=1965070 RepID=A0A443RKG2_9ACAR|nr:Exocyst complex component 4-like protein [Dinothrombium tinctorium]RWS15759.1 Exocyst complex component 4-like protein [Dinothrombium tinctorium]
MARSSTKESSTGLLMSVIRSLTASKDVDERDREKANLEREFAESDSRLDKLVLNHHTDLTSVMQAFSKISARLIAAKDKLRNVSEKLTVCQKLLHCKRDELKKLWLESVENRHVLELLNRVESISKVPNEVCNFINKKHYLHATKLLVESVSILEKDLENVDALKEVKADLISKKERMYELLVEELHKHIYVKSTIEVLKRYRKQGLDKKQPNVEGTPSRKVSVVDILSPALMQSNPTLKKRSPSSALQIDVIADQIEEDINLNDPEEDSRHFIAILIECLALLNKVTDAVEAIKDNANNELINIVKRTGRELLNIHSDSSLSAQNVYMSNTLVPVILRSSIVIDKGNRTHLLRDMLELLFQQFRCVVQVHETHIIPNLRRIETQKSLFGEAMRIYNMAEIWSKLQIVLQLVVDLHMDISGTNGIDKSVANLTQESNILTHSSTTVADLNSFYVKKRVGLNMVNTFGKIKKTPLFRFDLSSHAMSLNAYLQEQKEAMKEKAERSVGGVIDSINISFSEAEQYIVCQPLPENIVVIFNPLMKFISEIDDELNLEEGNHCPLHSYVTSCAKVFLNQVNIDLEKLLEVANKSLDHWKIISDNEVLLSKNQTRPLLQSTLIVERGIQDLKNLMMCLPLYADDFLNYMCNILSNYKETCMAAYRGIVQPESEDKRVISATWAKDEDINRFLKSLPNWAILQRSKLCAQSKAGTIGGASSMSFDESPEEIRLRNMRESEILTSNLTQDTLIPSHEILSDVNQLRILAQLQESMEWLGNQVNQVANSLQKFQGSDFFLSTSISSSDQKFSELSPISDVSVGMLHQLSKSFEELAETCLLVLHLEVRVHCFYFLLRVSTQSSFSMGMDTQEPDTEVVQLNKDLTSIDEALSISLQPWKLRYIFEGVGHLVSTILINSTPNIKRINQNGVKKMCRNIFAIQQCLTSITMSREVALDCARQYFELFYQTPEEILSLIVERGPQFQAQEYLNAINLLHRSLPGRDTSMLEAAHKRLTEILNEVAVSV